MAEKNKPTIRFQGEGGMTVAATIVASTGTAASTLLPAAQWSTSPLPDDHAVYTLVGRVSSDWSHLEHTLDLIIWELSGIAPEIGACITAQIMGPAPRFRIIITLLNRVNSDTATKLVKQFRELMNVTSDVGEERNRIIHDAWYLYTPTGQAAQFKSMSYRDQRYGIHTIDMKHIDEVLARIGRRQATASSLRNEVTALIKGRR
jgi:hypothetical protein